MIDRLRVIWFVLGIAAFSGWGFAQSDKADKAYQAAKAEIDKQLKSPSMPARRAAIRELRATNDPRASKDLRALVHKLTKAIDDQQKKLDPLLSERAELIADIDKRFAGKKEIARGSVENLLKKRDEVELKIGPAEESLRNDLATKDAVLAALGDLVTSLEKSAQEAETNEILGLFTKLKKTEERQVYLEILSRIRTPQSVAGLVSAALGEPDKAVRVLALTALTRLADRAAAPAVLQCLNDESWVVRAAAIQAAEEIGVVDAIPILVDRIEKEEGRLKDDVERALKILGGVTFHDNAALWKNWWTAESKKLKEIMDLLASSEAANRDEGFRQAAAAGFLLGISEAMNQRSLSVAAIDNQEARRTTKAEESLPKDDALFKLVESLPEGGDAFAKSVGEAISGRADDIRQVAITRLIMRPFVRSQDVEKRIFLLHILGNVKGKDAGTQLSAVARVLDTKKTKDAAELCVALRGLGRNGAEDAVKICSAAIKADDARKEVYLAAVAGLGEVGTKEAVRALLTALDEADSNATKPIASAKDQIVAELKRITKADGGNDYKAWSAWWAANKEKFKTDRDEAVAKGKDEKAVDEKRSTSFYGITTNSKRIVYVLDISGSMNEPAEYGGTVHTKIKVAKEELERSITALPDDAMFNIVLFSTTFKVWKKVLVPASAAVKKEAKEMIAAIEANGATNAYDSLAKAFELAGRGSFDKGYDILVDTIYFMSDGQPNQGLYTNPDDIIRHILELNATKKIQIHTIGVGKDMNAGFMQALAVRTGGTFVQK